MVIELAGLPGAGKTSLTGAITIPHAGRRDFSWVEAVKALSSWPVLEASLRLAVSIRPFRAKNLLRAVKLVFALRSYRPSDRRLVIMDQGMVQKLWSMVVETGSYPPQRLEDLVKALAPYAADHLVWVSVPPDVAAQRISGRNNGNSRFDGKAPEQTEVRLKSLKVTYMHVIELFQKHAGLDVTTLDGEVALAANAEKIDALASSYLESQRTRI